MLEIMQVINMHCIGMFSYHVINVCDMGMCSYHVINMALET